MSGRDIRITLKVLSDVNYNLSHTLERDKMTSEERWKFLFEMSLMISEVTKMKHKTYTKNE